MSWSDALENSVLDHVVGGPDYTRVATLYVGLSTTTPADDGTNFTEPGAGAYARVAKTNDATNFPAAAAGAKSNGTVIQFPTATAGWGTITHAGLFVASSGGVPIMTGTVTPNRTVSTNDAPKYEIGDLDFTLD